MTVLRKVLWFLLYVALLPLLVAVAVAALPLVLLLQAWDFVRLRWYCWREQCWTYLVCSPRRGWHEFALNNLAAALPPGVHLLWTTGAEAAGPLRRVLGAGTGRAKPYLAHVTLLSTRVRSLHDRLQSYKSHGRRESPVQAELRGLLGTELELVTGA